MSDENILIYEYRQPFKKHVVIAWNEKNFDQYANDFTFDLINNCIDSVSELPPDNLSEIPEEKSLGYEYSIKVDKNII